MRTKVNSIKIPDRFVRLCTEWHGGMDCMLYAVCSTGTLKTGTHHPMSCDTDEKWYLHLWRDLAADVYGTVCAARKGYNACDDGGDGNGHDADYPALMEFEAWIDCIVERLEEEYDLANWGE